MYKRQVKDEMERNCVSCLCEIKFVFIHHVNVNVNVIFFAKTPFQSSFSEVQQAAESLEQERLL